MQAYAIAFLTGAVFSALFIDKSVKRSVARVGRLSLAVFTVLFVVTEAVALLA